jgi:hypothetical protein
MGSLGRAGEHCPPRRLAFVGRAVSGDFERGLAAQASRTVITPHIDADTRRGSDFVSVTPEMTVTATDVAEALDRAWQAFRLAAASDSRGWDTASASAEVRPRAGPG